MALEVLRQAAANELRQFVDREGSQFPSLSLVWRALQTRGKLLAHENGFSWGLLPLAVCEAVGGEPGRALPLSTALECWIAAADVLDDVQDDDNDDALWRACGIAGATNVATFLLFLTQVALLRLRERGVSDAQVCQLVQLFANAGARACAGQQLDILRGSAEDVTESGYLGAIAQKSASLVECACRSGAIVGGATHNRVGGFAQFGFNVGMAMQISNDVAGVSSESWDRNDLRRRKRTLPVIFALECAPSPLREEMAAILRPDRLNDLSAEEVARSRYLLEATGALCYALTVADVYWQRALECVEGMGCGAGSLLLDLVTKMRGG